MTEDPVPGYTSQKTDTGFTNTANKISVLVTKAWVDGDGNLLDEKLIPDNLSVKLLRNGTPYREEYSLNASENWQCTFTDLPTHDADGEKYIYTVEEDLPENFTAQKGNPVSVQSTNDSNVYKAELVNSRNTEQEQEPKKEGKITDKEIQVEETKQMVEVGGKVTYTISYYNHLNTKADVTISDELNTGMKFVEADHDGTAKGQIVTWTMKDVEPFTGGTVTVTVEVTKEALIGADPKLNNTAVVKIGDVAQSAESNEITVYNPSWTVEKKVFKANTDVEADEAQVGDSLIYEITVKNTGNVAIEQPVTDTFTVDGKSVKLDLRLAEESQGVYADGRIKLEVGQTATLTAEYTVAETDKQLVNVVVVGDPEDPDTPKDEVTTEVEDHPDWTVVKTLTNQGTGENGVFKPGETAEFDITVTNKGNIDLDMTVTEDLAGARFIADENSKYTVSEDGISAMVTVPKLETVVLKAEYTVQEKDLSTELRNVVTTKVGEEEKPGDTPVPTEDRNPKLEVVKEVTSNAQAADGKYVLGETITYEVTVTNVGNLTLKDIVVSDAMTRPDGTLTIPSGIAVDTNIGALAPGDFSTITYTHVVTEAELGGNLTNVATATGTPEIPNPGEPDPAGSDDARVETDDPENCTITVTKQTLSGLDEAIILAAGAEFRVALFSDEAMTTQVGEARTIRYDGNSSTAQVTFDHLKRGTYYVAEVDASGAVLAAGEYDGGAFVPVYDGNSVVMTENGANAEFNFSNSFLILPTSYYDAKPVTITKNVKDIHGKAMKSKETFYAGIFTDETYTTLADTDVVGENIIPLRMNGKSSVSATIEMKVPQTGENVQLYITEVTSAGRPVGEGFEYDMEVENGSLTLNTETVEETVTITNTSNKEEEEEEETETNTSTKEQNSSKSTSDSTKAVKTGDETPILPYTGLLGISALYILIFLAKRRRREEA